MSQMHTSPIGNRWQPRLVISIMQDADRPLTMQGIYDAIRDRGHKKFSPSMVGACFAEIRDDRGREGYSMSPAVRFPDGYFYYWLTAAPGWRPRWKVTKDFRIVPAHSGEPEMTAENLTHHEPPMNAKGANKEHPTTAANEELFCCNPECKKSVPGPLPWCNDACRGKWRELVLLQPAEKPAQGRLF